MQWCVKTRLASIVLIWAAHTQAQMMCDCPGPDKPLGNAPNCAVACAGESMFNTMNSKAAKDAADKAAAAEKAKQLDAKKAAAEQQKKLAEQANERAIAAQNARDIEKLRLMIKDSSSAGSDRALVLKPIPPANTRVRSQLDCIAGNATATNGDERNNPVNSWDKRGADCTPVVAGIAPPSPPTSAALRDAIDPARLQEFLIGLGRTISAKRQALTKQEQEVRAGEQALRQEESKAANAEKPAAESDALRRAKAAWEKAKAERARIAEELKSLETQESDARSKVAPAAQ